MNTSKNYDQAACDLIVAQSPVDFAKAQILAKQLDKNVRSIISKCRSLDVPYISKPSPAKKKAAPTKADLVSANALALDAESLDGLEKATGQSLNNLLMAIR